MMDDTIAKISSENLTRLRTIGDEAYRTPRTVSVLSKFFAQRKKVLLGIELKCQGVRCIALVAAALSIAPPQSAKRIKVSADHEHRRTARAWLLLFLLSLFTFPLLKFTFHALLELLALVVADQ
ncbi:MAG: hypothetical protein L0Y68_00345 [Candidatus Dadabacteria bacterium]|nr:hypothetical protein [Candidatus Dadabacteria bacterium]